MRTFNGNLFKPIEDIDRIYCSLRSLRIDPRISENEMLSIT
jgi:branched-subunit amino acid aminotransferase/4-amino-4-deoxychorismate lyase